MKKITPFPVSIHKLKYIDEYLVEQYSNPYMFKNKDKINEEMWKFKIIFKDWFQETMSSSSGYSYYRRSAMLDKYDIEQTIGVATSYILLEGKVIGFKYGISFLEHSSFGGISRAGSLDNLKEFIEITNGISRMMSAGEEDKRLAYGILLNNFLDVN